MQKYRLFVLLFALTAILSPAAMAQPRVMDEAGYNQLITKNPQQKIVSLKDYIPRLETKFYYATTQNFTHTVLYIHPEALALKPLALKLQKAAVLLAKQGFGILIFDAYRPYSVTKKMWEIVPDSRYAANPVHGSDHNRGAAVDLTLYDLKTGQPIAMPTEFDNFTPKAHLSYQNLPATVKANRRLLQQTMIAVGLKPLATEWWHFSLPDARKYPVLDMAFEKF